MMQVCKYRLLSRFPLAHSNCDIFQKNQQWLWLSLYYWVQASVGLRISVDIWQLGKLSVFLDSTFRCIELTSTRVVGFESQRRVKILQMQANMNSPNKPDETQCGSYLPCSFHTAHLLVCLSNISVLVTQCKWRWIGFSCNTGKCVLKTLQMPFKHHATLAPFSCSPDKRIKRRVFVVCNLAICHCASRSDTWQNRSAFILKAFYEESGKLAS